MSSPTERYRTVFLSDVHLGAAGSKPNAVQDFLRAVDCDNLYLVGDIIDGWVMRSKKWRQEDTNVIRTILGKSKRGTRVCLTPGNHDSFLRRLNGSELGFIEIDHSFEHELVDGRKLLVVHGDLFDPACVRYPSLALFGAWMYEYLQALNGMVNRRILRRWAPIDFCSTLKRISKGLFTKRNYFDALLIEHAVEAGYQGVVCGHVHRPELRVLPSGFQYVNTGDWVEHKTAVVEDFEGRLTLLYFDEWAAARSPQPALELESAVLGEPL